MTTIRLVLLFVLGTAFAGLNLAFWAYVAMRGYPRLQAWITQHHGVKLESGFRGSITVIGARSVRQLLSIHGLLFGYWMAAFAVWALAVGLSVLVMGLVQP